VTCDHPSVLVYQRFSRIKIGQAIGQ
jgi:hypothetical protein